MQKDFDAWNKIKKELDKKEKVSLKEGEIWWMSVGLNVAKSLVARELFLRPRSCVKKIIQ